MEKRIALVRGDGSGPEMMEQACRVAIKAASLDDVEIVFEDTPMGWAAFGEYGDTLPEESFRRATEIGILFFGAVGNTELDRKNPEMAPEPRCLLRIRKDWGLLLNFRPMIFYKSLDHLCGVRPERIPPEGIRQIWIRYLLEDSYFGTADLMEYIPEDVRKRLGIKLKKDVTGDEEIVTELAYFRKDTLEKYFRAAFSYARTAGLPLISVDKQNVMARFVFWRKVCQRIAKEFPDVQTENIYVDAANERHFVPAMLHGVIACGNEHGDILSDAAAKAMGSLGLMCSSAINPETGLAMFESGAGTAPTLAGKDVANPIGRILSASLMLRHIGAMKGADAIDSAVRTVLQDVYITAELLSDKNESSTVLGTEGMAEAILSRIPDRKEG